MRITKYHFIIFVLFNLSVWILLRFFTKTNTQQHLSILWWTPILRDYKVTRKCGFYTCNFSTDRSYLKNRLTKIIAFYGSDVNITDFPIPRLSHHSWALIHEESPKNVPFIQYESVLKHFNFSATFSRYSDFPLTVQYIDSIELLTTRKYLVPIGEKNMIKMVKKLAPAVYIQSICDTMSGRDAYIKELMQYIEIDSYGKCLNNRILSPELSENYLETIDSDEFYKFLARYKFIISYENAICDDYITEKFWRPLIIGSIPVYFGSPTIRDWIPNNKSVIFIDDFESLKQLAKFLKYLDGNDVEYNKYLDHKYSQINAITNYDLLQSIISRKYKRDTFFENIECFLCEMAYLNVHNIVDKKAYNCNDQLMTPKMERVLIKNEWHSFLRQAKCQADVLNYFLTKNIIFSPNDFSIEMIQRIEQNVCSL